MSKQLSLFAQDEWWTKVFGSFPEEKKAEAVSVLKELVIAKFKKENGKGERHGKRKD